MEPVRNHFYYFLLLMMLVIAGQAQVSFRFNPELYGRSVTGLFKAELINYTPAVTSGVIRITVRNSSGAVLITATSGIVRVPNGANELQVLTGDFTRLFAATASANALAQTGYFTPGNYEYCFEFSGPAAKPADQGTAAEHCFSATIQGLLPLELVAPWEGGSSCQKRPLFTWQPPVPVISSYRYRLVVCSIGIDQTADDAMLYNLPVIDQQQIAGNMLLYPPGLPDLHTGQSYAWNVTVVNGPDVISRSATWQFKVDCLPEKKDSAMDSYRQPSTFLNGNYYRVADTLKFTLHNPYNATSLQYSITDVADASRPIKNLPAVNVATGLNKIAIPLDEVRGIHNHTTNLMKIYNIGDRPLYLQFQYQRSER